MVSRYITAKSHVLRLGLRSYHFSPSITADKHRTDYESGQLSQNDSEDVSSPEEPEVAKPLMNITPRTKNAKDRSNRPEPKGKHHRRSMSVKMPPPLVNDEVEQSSEEGKVLVVLVWNAI